MTDTLTKAVVRAIEAAPCSARRLAEEAGVSGALLTWISQGKRRATPEVAGAIADALSSWAKTCDVEARKLRRLIMGRRS